MKTSTILLPFNGEKIILIPFTFRLKNIIYFLPIFNIIVEKNECINIMNAYSEFHSETAKSLN